MNNHGYVMSLTSFLLVIPAFLLIIIFINMSVGFTSFQETVLVSDDVSGVSKDLQSQIPKIGREVLKDKSEEVIKSGNPLPNSREEIKNEIQDRINVWSLKYNHDQIDVHCDVLDVDNSQDPFQIEIKSIINVQKDEIKHSVNLIQKISLINESFPIMDPLPFLKCKKYGGATIGKDKIMYGSSLSEYLKSSGFNNSQAYENAISPLFIKKCPYDPYELHGSTSDFVNLKNCIDNGFYHESNDGACFFCRLEGRGVCPHYGFETFILPAPSVNITPSNNSSKLGISSVDHVIFNETSFGAYYGHLIVYSFDESHYFYIFLDNSHRKKYGLPPHGG